MNLFSRLLLTGLVSFLGSAAMASDTLLECRLQAETRRDLQTITVTQTEAGLVLTQTTRGGAVVESSLPERQYRSRNIRLSNDRGGNFRWLRYEYNEFFREMDWFVVGQGAGFRSVARANCR